MTRGGRVLCATALGQSVSDAQQRAYEAINTLHFDDCYYRTDIGHRAINRA
ncbi:MAG: phosphoribosylglycinamide synthetase C domain-containing protein [Saccharospirillum sp.]